MEKKIHLYVSNRSFAVWLSALCILGSIPTRLFNPDISTCFWSQVFLPSLAALFYVAIILLNGKECFYKTSIPVWMISAYCAILVMRNVESLLLVWLLWLALGFFSLVYTEITSGMRKKCIWILNPGILAVLATFLYIRRDYFLKGNVQAVAEMVPDLLLIIGCWILTFAIHVHPIGEYHRSWGDRSDGRRLRSLSPMDQVAPYIMVERNTATNMYEEAIEITQVDRYIRQKRREGLTNFGIMHVFLACYCRTLAKYPGLNRFISGQKVYTHGNDIQFCMTIKKEMSTTSPETIVKVHLTPKDTAYDVYQKVNAEIEKAKAESMDSDFDNTAHLFMLIPGVFLKFLVWLLKLLDYFGMLPAFLLEISPFHGSIFMTSMGSLGIPPVFHHLYDFGNLPVFCAFGCKRREAELQEDGTVLQKKYVDCKFSLDERIVDGYYYAAFFKHYKRIMAHPETLDRPPEEINSDID